MTRAALLVGLLWFAACDAPASSPVTTPPSDGAAVDPYDDGGTLRGRFVLPRAVNAADLEVAFADGSGAVPVEADGSFELPLHDAAVEVRLLRRDTFDSALAAARSRDAWFAPFALGAHGGATDVDLGPIDLDAGFPLDVRVVDRDGTAASGARVVVLLGRSLVYALTADADGAAYLPGLRGAGYRVLFGETQRGDAWDPRSAELVPSAGLRGPLEVTLHGGRAVVVRCVGDGALSATPRRVRLHAEPVDPVNHAFGWERSLGDVTALRAHGGDDGVYDVTIEVAGCETVVRYGVLIESRRDTVLEVALDRRD